MGGAFELRLLDSKLASRLPRVLDMRALRSWRLLDLQHRALLAVVIEQGWSRGAIRRACVRDAGRLRT